jgi:hypothetical protein
MTISRVENCVVWKIILVHHGVMSFAQDILEADKLAIRIQSWPVVSRQIATESPRGKSKIIFPLQKILFQSSCQLSVAQYPDRPAWIFLFILNLAERNNSLQSDGWLIVVPFFPPSNLSLHYTQPYSHIGPTRSLCLAEGLSTA